MAADGCWSKKGARMPRSKLVVVLALLLLVGGLTPAVAADSSSATAERAEVAVSEVNQLQPAPERTPPAGKPPAGSGGGPKCPNPAGKTPPACVKFQQAPCSPDAFLDLLIPVVGIRICVFLP